MNDILISIVVPVYNSEKYLDDCINSLLNQTYDNIEILFINDGSSDNSLNILNKFKSNGRIKIINQKNSGAFIARKVGILNAKGKYIMFVDSDDYISNNTVEVLVNYIKEYNPDIVKFKFLTFPNESKKIVYFDETEHPVYMNNIDFNMINKTLLTTNKLNNLSTMIVKKNIITFPQIEKRINLSEDFLMSFFIYNNAKSVLFVDDCLYFYRNNSNSTIHRVSFNEINCNLNDEKLVFEIVKDNINNWEGNNNLYINMLINRLLDNISLIYLNKCINLKKYNKKEINSLSRNLLNYIQEIPELKLYKKFCKKNKIDNSNINRIKNIFKDLYKYFLIYNKLFFIVFLTLLLNNIKRLGCDRSEN